MTPRHSFCKPIVLLLSVSAIVRHLEGPGTRGREVGGPASEGGGGEGGGGGGAAAGAGAGDGGGRRRMAPACRGDRPVNK